MNQKIIDALKKGRTDCKLKQEEVANMLNVKKNTISNYENGVSEPDIDTLAKLCNIYQIDCGELLKYAYEDPNNTTPIFTPLEKELVTKYSLLPLSERKVIDDIVDALLLKTTKPKEKE